MIAELCPIPSIRIEALGLIPGMDKVSRPNVLEPKIGQGAYLAQAL